MNSIKKSHKNIRRCVIETVALIVLCSMTAYAYDFMEPSNLTEEELRNGLHGNLKNYAGEFLECEEQYGINAAALASIAALESGWGESYMATEKNNFFGWTDASGGYATFDSAEDCISHVANFLSENYLSEDGTYYSGGTRTSDIAENYSPTEDWPSAVNEIMEGIMENSK